MKFHKDYPRSYIDIIDGSVYGICLNASETTPWGYCLSKLYYETGLLKVCFDQNERIGSPHNGGEHTLYLKTNGLNILVFIELVEEEFFKPLFALKHIREDPYQKQQLDGGLAYLTALKQTILEINTQYTLEKQMDGFTASLLLQASSRSNSEDQLEDIADLYKKLKADIGDIPEDVAKKVLSLIGKTVKFKHTPNRLGIVLALRTNVTGFYPGHRYPAKVMVFDTLDFKPGCSVKGQIFEYSLEDLDLTVKTTKATPETVGEEFFTLYQAYLENSCKSDNLTKQIL